MHVVSLLCCPNDPPEELQSPIHAPLAGRNETKRNKPSGSFFFFFLIVLRLGWTLILSSALASRDHVGQALVAADRLHE